MSARVLAWHPEVPGLLSPDDDLSWRDAALCAQTDAEAFFPERGESSRPAKRICQRCEARIRCLEYALDHEENWGIWGGLSERERRMILADRERESGASRCPSGRHVLAGDNVLPDGKCRKCSDAARRTNETRWLAKRLAA